MNHRNKLKMKKFLKKKKIKLMNQRNKLKMKKLLKKKKTYKVKLKK